MGMVCQGICVGPRRVEECFTRPLCRGEMRVFVRDNGEAVDCACDDRGGRRVVEVPWSCCWLVGVVCEDVRRVLHRVSAGMRSSRERY